LHAGEGKNRFMRMKLFFLAGALFAIIGRVGAGSIDLAPKETAPPSITESEPWQFTIAAPGGCCRVARAVNAAEQQ
jgi:hypothetical protein